MARRPFRFGASVWTAGSRAEWRAKALRVEDLGYATLLVADHLASLLPPFPALLAAADATSRLRVGTFVLNNDFRHPTIVAREAATVDLLSEGRFELGIGAGHMKVEYDRNGIPWQPLATRTQRLTESISVLKQLFAGAGVTFAGTHYRLAGETLYPRPLQRPCPPLLIGGNSRAVLSLAGRKADIVGFTGFGQRASGEIVLSGFTATSTAERIGWVREAAGPRFDALELNALIQAVVVTDDRLTKAAELAPRFPGLTAGDLLDSPYLLIGTAAQMVAALQERRERFGLSYYVVFEAALDALAPVVARLAGT